MFEKIARWLNRKPSANDTPTAETLQKERVHHRAQGAQPQRPSRRADDVEQDEDRLVRKKLVREDTGTHEKLTILDESEIDTGEETGLDPYNTGAFDRSRNWDKRFRK